MEITGAGTRASKRANPNWFTGCVWQDPIVEAPAPARVRAVWVSFEPGARTNWHTHPLGQTLIVVSGVGRIGTWNGPVREFRPGDTIWIPPDEKHWHGAAPGNAMVHIAIQEALNGTPVDWLEAVSQEDYLVEPL